MRLKPPKTAVNDGDPLLRYHLVDPRVKNPYTGEVTGRSICGLYSSTSNGWPVRILIKDLHRGKLCRRCLGAMEEV